MGYGCEAHETKYRARLETIKRKKEVQKEQRRDKKAREVARKKELSEKPPRKRKKWEKVEEVPRPTVDDGDDEEMMANGV